MTTDKAPPLTQTSDPKGFWNTRFDREDYFYGTEPNLWLASQAGLLEPGMRALSVADGEGRNGVWLAQMGLEVTAVDISPKALEKAANLARARGVTLDAIEADLRSWAWPREAFDLVVAIFAHFEDADRSAIHASMLAATRPGGRIILEAYTPYQRLFDTGGPRDLSMLYTGLRLASDFKGAHFEHLEETETDLAEGPGHDGRSAVVRMIARKPG